MNISQQNIGEYIDFLHIKKHSYPADATLKSKWQQLPNSEIYQKLRQLYHHWNITEQSGAAYEQEFFNLQRDSYTPPTHLSQTKSEHTTYPPPPQQATNPYPPQQKSTNYLPLVLVGLLLLLGGAFAFYYFANQPAAQENTAINNDASVLNNGKTPTSTNMTPATATASTTEPIAVDPTAEETKASKETIKQERIGTIVSLIKAEQNREIETILNSFSDGMTQYWDKKNPTKQDLKDLYYKTWSNTGEHQYNNVKVQQVDENTYDLIANYSYYSIKDDVQKDVPVQTRYIFDKDGKIVKTYGIKKPK